MVVRIHETAKRADHDKTGDTQLIRRAKEGNEKAFTALVRRYEDTVYRFAVRVCRDQEAATETLQDTFINVFRKLKQFDEKSKFTTWLYKIVANNCLMKRRKSKLTKGSVSIDAPEGFMENPLRDEEGNVIQTVPSWKETPLDVVIDKELKSRMDRAISRLPVDYRAVFILRDVEDRSAEETASILNLSIPAVKSRLRRARMFLRNELDDYMRQDEG